MLFNAPLTFTNALNVNTINVADGYLNQPAFIGFDPGVDEQTAMNYLAGFQPRETLLGAPLIGQDVQINASGTATINKTYQMPMGVPITPAVIQQLEAYVAGVTGGEAKVTFQQELNNTWGTWAQNTCTNVYHNQQTSWGVWTSGTITVQSTIATTGTYIYNSAVIQSSWLNWQAPVRRKESEAERRARQEAEVKAAAEYAAQQAAAAKEALKVKARAEKILVRHLSEDQRKVLAEKGYFDEEVNGKTYRLHRSTHGNIRELDKDRKMEVASLCVQPGGVPTDDAVLAQLLWLRADEKALLRVANRRELVVARP